MKLSKLKSVGKVILVKDVFYSTVQANLNQYCDLKEGDLLYTKKSAQEYAKECVREAIILNSGGAVSDDMIQRTIDSVFTEDMKDESR